MTSTIVALLPAAAMGTGTDSGDRVRCDAGASAGTWVASGEANKSLGDVEPECLTLIGREEEQSGRRSQTL